MRTLVKHGTCSISSLSLMTKFNLSTSTTQSLYYPHQDSCCG